MPRAGRAALARLLRTIEVGAWSSGLGWLAKRAAKSFGARHVSDRLHKLGDILAVDSQKEFYRMLMSSWAERLVVGAKYRATTLNDHSQWADLPDFIQRMMHLDTVTYLPDDILVKVDRASMAVSLESRVPLLDHRVVEFAWRIPFSMKIKSGQSKWLLRQVLYKHVPRKLIG